MQLFGNIAAKSCFSLIGQEDTRLGKTEKTERIALIADPQVGPGA